MRRGPQFGIDLSQPHALVRLTLHENHPALTASAIQALVTNLAAAVMGISPPPAVRLPGTVVVMVRLGKDDPAALADLRTDVIEVTHRLDGTLSLGATIISGICRNPADFAHAHRASCAKWVRWQSRSIGRNGHYCSTTWASSGWW